MTHVASQSPLPAAAAAPPRAAGARAGFTIVELSIGLVVLSMVILAVAGLWQAVGAQWVASDQAQSIYTQTALAGIRVEQLISNAKYAGMCRAGSVTPNASVQPAALMLWCNDNDSPANSMQLSEIGLLQLNTANSTLYKYVAVFPASMSPLARMMADQTYNYSAITASTAPEDFQQLPYVTPIAVAHNVTAASFNVQSLGGATQRPTVEYTLEFNFNGKTVMRYGVATLRMPQQPVP